MRRVIKVVWWMNVGKGLRPIILADDEILAVWT